MTNVTVDHTWTRYNFNFMNDSTVQQQWGQKVLDDLTCMFAQRRLASFNSNPGFTAEHG